MKRDRFWHIETWDRSYVVQGGGLKGAFGVVKNKYDDVDVKDVVKIFETLGNQTKEHSVFELIK